jgi:putative transposase
VLGARFQQLRLQPAGLGCGIRVPLDHEVHQTQVPLEIAALVHTAPAEYLSIRYIERPAEADIELSVGTVGDSYDDAPVETIFGLFKAEVIHRNGPWRIIEAGEFATLERGDRFDNRHLFGPIGNTPPVAREQMYYGPQEALATGVGLN